MAGHTGGPTRPGHTRGERGGAEESSKQHRKERRVQKRVGCAAAGCHGREPGIGGGQKEGTHDGTYKGPVRQGHSRGEQGGAEERRQAAPERAKSPKEDRLQYKREQRRQRRQRRQKGAQKSPGTSVRKFRGYRKRGSANGYSSLRSFLMASILPSSSASTRS